MAGPSVSVVIPTYNRANILPACLDSVLAQTFTDIEVLVVDDGSTDGTRAVIDRYPMVRLLTQANAGAASARNVGMSHAGGEFIAFLDSDDQWEPTSLAERVACLRENPEYGMCCSDFTEWSGGRVLHESAFAARGFTDLRSGAAYLDLLAGCFPLPSTSLFRAAALREIGAFDTSMEVAEDYDLFLRLARRAPLGILPAKLTKRIFAEDNLTGNMALCMQSLLRVLLKELVRLDEVPLPDEVERPARRILRRRIAEAAFNLAYELYARGDGRGARRVLREHARYGVERRGARLWMASYVPRDTARKMRGRIRGLLVGGTGRKAR